MFDINLGLSVWTTFVFLSLLGILWKFAWGPMLAVVQAREDGIQDWPFYITFAMFRLASISQGIYARALQGNASSASAMDFGERAMRLAKLAWDNQEAR